ncbi:hypothetical protein D9619_007715 [Psilocybe cf. subviscida]|uniref:Uncharacterized protein n=1 Tax=Psilocybe cf. subviscida TaxID=2480587 RepID=A0A8H5ESP4_9AGAR|nr:hypothetical protein D9619_007715 [Psilocybe cf. subviscida]
MAREERYLQGAVVTCFTSLATRRSARIKSGGLPDRNALERLKSLIGQGRVDTEERKPTLGEELIAGNERRSARAKHSSKTSVASARCHFTHPSPTSAIDPGNNIDKTYVVDHRMHTVVVNQMNDEWADDASSFQTDRE